MAAGQHRDPLAGLILALTHTAAVAAAGGEVCRQVLAGHGREMLQNFGRDALGDGADHVAESLQVLRT